MDIGKSHDLLSDRFAQLASSKEYIDVLHKEFKISVDGIEISADFLLNTVRGYECAELKTRRGGLKYTAEGQISAYRRAGYYTCIITTEEMYINDQPYIDSICEDNNCSLYLLTDSCNNIKKEINASEEDGYVVKDQLTNLSWTHEFEQN